MSRIGKNQLQRLVAIGGAGSFLVVPDALSRSMVNRGLMQSFSEKGGMVAITADGYRALADAIDRGEVSRAQMLDDIRERNRARRETKQ